MRYLMKCGHVANAKTSDGKPCCAICVGLKEEALIVDRECEGTEGLEGRKAKCYDCGEITDSRWSLPFFDYRPDEEYDGYYDGCRGWD